MVFDEGIPGVFKEKVMRIGGARARVFPVEQAAGHHGLRHQLGTEVTEAVAVRLAHKIRTQWSARPERGQLQAQPAQSEELAVLANSELGELASSARGPW